MVSVLKPKNKGRSLILLNRKKSVRKRSGGITWEVMGFRICKGWGVVVKNTDVSGEATQESGVGA
jgi:hypothetical protein